ncbi:GbsR/MarR family transcriptional regulator [Halobacillus seohaensis]|uniref:HTH-type transcriptional regulator n=1 Tax=Halobacillus seohaensis TaxID=447421 RepID=A0ABW2EMN2_9BACI
MGMNKDQTLENIQTNIIHEFSKTLEMFGLTPSDSRLFVALYLHDEPMTLEELSEALGKSKTSISTGIRSLSDQGLVERVWIKGVRKDLYQADEKLYKKFMTSYIQKWIDASHTQSASLHAIQNTLPPSHEEPQSRFLQDRLDQMIGFNKEIMKAFKKIDPAITDQ